MYTHIEHCISMARGPLRVCDVNISCCLFSLGTALLWSHHISWYFKGMKRFAWCCLIYHNWLLHLFIFSWNCEHFSPVYFYVQNVQSTFFFLFCIFFSFSLSPLRLVFLAACCSIVSLPCEFPADAGWNQWEASALAGCHVAIGAAVARRRLLLDEIPVCVAAGGHMGILCYSVSVTVPELAPPEDFGSTTTDEVAWIYRYHLGMTVTWGRRKQQYLSFWKAFSN